MARALNVSCFSAFREELQWYQRFKNPVSPAAAALGNKHLKDLTLKYILSSDGCQSSPPTRVGIQLI